MLAAKGRRPMEARMARCPVHHVVGAGMSSTARSFAPLLPPSFQQPRAVPRLRTRRRAGRSGRRLAVDFVVHDHPPSRPVFGTNPERQRERHNEQGEQHDQRAEGRPPGGPVQLLDSSLAEEAAIWAAVAPVASSITTSPAAAGLW